uniref:SCP domain-containing protein n=1 Tax=Strongyloides venezuelensis TaxID=75913 RepID=A0A0K0FJ93_STRVS
MQIFNCNYYISISILCKLFFQNQALENNARSEDKVSASLALIQNYESLRNFVKRDAIISPITEIKETENLEKRETKKSKKKVVKKKKSIKKKILEEQNKKTFKQKKKKKKYKKKKFSKKKTKKPLSKKSSSKKPMSKKPSSKSPTKTTERIITTKIQKSRKSSTTKSKELEQWKFNLYEQINNLRWVYQAKELKVNETLAELAQDLTDRFVYRSFRNLEVELKNIQSKKKISFGVLFYYVKASDKYKPFSKWTLGAPFIDLRYPERFPSGGDFTLLIWSSSTQIGCGISKNYSKSTIVTICLISPKGNIKGQFAQNIHRAKFKIYFPLIRKINP